MARRPTTRDDDEDDDWDADGWDDPGEYAPDDDADDEPQVRCPLCRAWKLEDAPRCPTCGQYPSAEDGPPERKPAWVLVMLAVTLAVALWMAAG